MRKLFLLVVDVVFVGVGCTLCFPCCSLWFLMLFSVILCFGVRGYLSVVKEGDGGGEGDDEDV